ncbi:D-alanyl-D-alanine carboxypeptidase/D-alanyl-D-alanine-endopeptidase, partial [Nocardioides sp.]|uniref:D-alanyl-D-alanine carboxypeptidase/D-alanyl-D-alanine endopeptidase n=1 Tax=Nocardioides sp. TaxID=35761 RepID=UPI00271633D3
APRTAAIASVDSAPLGQVVGRILDVSDNDASEVLLRHVGLAASGEGSIAAGQDGVRTLLRRAGVRMGASVLHDGSGLSRANRMDPSLLVSVLQLAASAARPGLRPIVAGLPIAGFTGSLTDRMDQGPAAGRGRVRAKTGTLRSVSSLAGLATDLEGNVMVFVLMADRVRDDDNLIARVALDNAAAALGACSCSG